MKYERNDAPIYPLEEEVDKRSRGFAHSEKIIAGVKAARERKDPHGEPKCSCVFTIDPNCPRGHGRTAEPKCERCGRELIKESDLDVGGDNAPFDRLDVGNCRNCPPTPEPEESEGKAAEVRQRLEEKIVWFKKDGEWLADAVTEHIITEIDATKQIERQTPAIIERFIADVKNEIGDQAEYGKDRWGYGVSHVVQAMQTVKARQTKGE